MIVLRQLARDFAARPGYYVKKLAVRLENRFSRYRLYDGAVLSNATMSLRDYDVVFFYLDHQLSHIGDQLFFKPLVTKLATSGMRVAVQPRAHMRFLFERHLDELARFRGTNQRLLVVSKQEARADIETVLGPSAHWFLFQLHQMSVNQPIADFIARRFAESFHLPEAATTITRNDFIDFPTPRSPLVAAPPPERKVVLYNDYVDSGRWRTYGLRERLLGRLNAERDVNDYVILLGSAKDREGDPRLFDDVVDLDLRGKTSLEDMFGLFARHQIDRVYTLDTAVLHIANIYDVPVRLAFRRFFRKGERRQKQLAYASMFAKERPPITYV